MITAKKRLKEIISATKNIDEDDTSCEFFIKKTIFSVFLKLASDGLSHYSDIKNLFPSGINHMSMDIYSHLDSEELTTIRNLIQKNYNDQHDLLVAAAKVLSQTSSALYAALGSKEQNKDRIQKAQKAYDAAAEIREAQLESFQNARRCEEYTRMLLPAYRSRDFDDIAWGILMCLRTDIYSPRVDVAQRRKLVKNIINW